MMPTDLADLRNLLRAVADDTDHPMGFSVADVMAEGTRRARRRVWGWTSLWAAAAVVVILMLSQLLTRPDPPPFPAPAPATTTTTTTPAPSVSTRSAAPPVISEADQKLVAECATTPIYPPVFIDPSSPPTSFPMPSPTTSDLTGWRVILRADDDYGTSAGLVSADGRQYAVCNRVHDASTDSKAELIPLKQPQNIPVPSSWTDPANAHLVDMPLGWSQICQMKPTGKVCPDELYYGVGVGYDGVARVHIEWPDKTSNDYLLTNGYYVARHLEKRVPRPVNRTARDMQNLPSLYISFYDAAGKLLIRYDHNPSMPIPATCPTDHGC